MVRLYRRRAGEDVILSLCDGFQTTALHLTSADLRELTICADHFIAVKTDNQLREFGARGQVDPEPAYVMPE